MKKILAIVLTLAMLLSMVAVGTSAATREVTQDEGTENHYWMFQSGNSWHPVKFTDPSQTVELDIRLDDATSELTNYSQSNAPSLSATAIGLGENNPSVAYNFTVGTWYTVKWVSAGGSTEIFVNGESVGTVSAEITYLSGDQFYWKTVLVSMDNVKVGSQTFDFEGDYSAWNTESTQGKLMVIETPGAVHNNLVYSYDVVKSEKKAYSHNIADGNDGQYMYITDVPTTSKAFARVSFDVFFTKEGSTLFGPDYLSGNKIGVTPAGVGTLTLATPMTLNTWHHVSIESYIGNNASFVKVDGGDASATNNDGIISAVFNSNTICCAGKWAAVTNIVFEESDDAANYTTVATEDFSDGTWNDFGSAASGNGVVTTIVEKGEETVKQDLGLKYWHFQAGNTYAPVSVGNVSNYDVEMDICLDEASSGLFNQFNLGQYPMISTTQIGVGDSARLNYTINPGTWYHVKWDALENGTTDIYVDGVKIGNVGAVCSHYDGLQYVSWTLISIDNLKIAGVSTDFEDGKAHQGGGQGQSMEYVLMSETIFDKIPTPEVTGDAVALSSPFDGTLTNYEISSMKAEGKNMILDFNLKLLPQTNERIADSQGNHWFEFWLDSACQNRVCIGTEAVGVQRKGTNDWTAFDFGANTWHRVTIEVLGSYNTVRIYVDTTLVYEGTCGDVDWLDGRYLIGNVYNVTALVNNYNVYANKTYQKFNTDFSDVDNDAGECVVNSADPCSKIHFPGNTVNTTPETCYSTGIDTTTCALCDHTEEHVIATYAHNWSSYDINSKTEDGLVYNYCRNSNGCTARHYTTIPANYSGTLYQYYDMSDDFVLNCNSGWSSDYWTVADGKLKFTEAKNTNYNEFDLNREIATNNWAWFMDVTFNGTFDTNDTKNYGHVAYFWFGGTDRIMVQAGYDFDNGCFFIRPNETKGTPFKAKTAAYALEYGKQYNFGLTFEYDTDEFTCSMKLWLDNQVVLELSDVDDEEILFNVEYSGSTFSKNIWRVFGVEHDIDNMAIGTADFSTFSSVLGDVDGDWTLSAADAVVYRRYFSAQPDAIDLAKVAVADMNNDGAVNAKDLLALRITLAA